MNEWKHIKDELPKSKPEKRVPYLCYNGYDVFVTEWRDYKGGAWFDNYFGDVKYWMELPEKPKGGVI